MNVKMANTHEEVYEILIIKSSHYYYRLLISLMKI